MAKIKQSLMGGSYVEAIPKKTRQGTGKHTKYASSSRYNHFKNNARKLRA